MQLSRALRLRVRLTTQLRVARPTTAPLTRLPVATTRLLSTAAAAPATYGSSPSRPARGGSGSGGSRKGDDRNKPWQSLQHIATHFTSVQLLPDMPVPPTGTPLSFHRLPTHTNGVWTIGVFAPLPRVVPATPQDIAAIAPTGLALTATAADATAAAAAAPAAAAAAPATVVRPPSPYSPPRLIGFVLPSSAGVLAALMDQQRVRIDGAVGVAGATTSATTITNESAATVAVTALPLALKLWTFSRDRSAVLLALTHTGVPSAAAATDSPATAAAAVAAPLDRATLVIPYVASDRTKARAELKSPEGRAMAMRTAAGIDPVGDADRSFHPHGKAPKCTCGLEAKLAVHSKADSPHVGRPFWRCPQKTRTKQCTFMRWADDRPRAPPAPKAPGEAEAEAAATAAEGPTLVAF